MAGGKRGRGGMCGRGDMHVRGACMTCTPPGHILWLRHTVNERAVRILLECILVMIVMTYFYRAGGERHGPSARLPDPPLVVKVRISVLFTNLWQ